jgi:hypothetical protein
MKQRPLYCACALVCISATMYAQSKISGVVADNKGQPLPYSNVMLIHQQDSTMIKGAIASEKGEYIFQNVQPGHLLLQVSMVGFRTMYSKPFRITADKDIEIEMLMLDEDPRLLGEVEVVAKKPLFEQQIDKMVVNVESSITAAGGTALEILARSPGITVNNQSNTININGKQGVLIMFNGKQMRLPAAAIVQMLSGMSASDIEKIEIITNPSSKYDAQGDAGIINIVSKRNPDLGTTGSVTLSGGYGMRGKYSGSASLSHRTKKFSMYVDFTHFRNYTRQIFSLERTIVDSHTITQSKREADMLVQRSTFQADYKLSDKTVIGATVGGFRDNWNMIAKNTSTTQMNGEQYSKISLRDQETNNWSHWMGNFNLSHRFSNSSGFKFDLDYLNFYDNNPHQYTNQYHYNKNDSSALNHISISKRTPIDLVVLKADYEKSFAKVKYEAGAKAVLTKLNNNVNVRNDETGQWREDTIFSQQYKMKDQVLAAYNTLSFPVSPKTDAQLGLRAEHTLMDIVNASGKNVFNLNFWSLFPTAFVSTKLRSIKNFNFQQADGLPDLLMKTLHLLWFSQIRLHIFLAIRNYAQHSRQTSRCLIQ